MKVKKLIKLLEKCDQKAEIIITGCYGSESDDFDVKQYKRSKRDYFTSQNKESEHIVCFHSDICSG